MMQEMNMTSILKGTVQSGRLELTVPGDWPNGTQVEIKPIHKTLALDD